MVMVMVMEILWSLIVITVCGLVIHVCDVVLIKPKRIRSKLFRQGIRGPPPSFLWGNTRQINQIRIQSKPNINPFNFSHQDWLHSIFPYIQKWTQQYGKVFMYSSGNQQHLYIGEAKLLKELKVIKSVDYGKPVYLARTTEPLLGDGIIRANGPSWEYQRKLIAPNFFLHKVKGMLGMMEESSKDLVRRWENEIEKETRDVEIIVDKDLRTVSADTISRACFGSSYEKGRLIFAKLAALQDATSKQSMIFSGPFDLWFLPTKRNRAVWRLKKEVDELILQVIKNRQERNSMTTNEESVDKDLLHLLLESVVNNNEENKLTHKDERFLVDTCKNIYFAGYETSALSVSWCLVLLSFYPEWQDRVRAEILETCGPHPCQQSLDMDTLGRLKTLNMVILETMRLYGPGVLMSREAFAEIKLGNLTIPKGLHIWHLIPLIHRETDNWGVDANEFKPERFADGISHACKYPQAYVPFGYGLRTCLGQTFGTLQIKIILCHLISTFTFTISPNYRHSPIYKMLLMPEFGAKLLVNKVM